MNKIPNTMNLLLYVLLVHSDYIETERATNQATLLLERHILQQH